MKTQKSKLFVLSTVIFFSSFIWQIGFHINYHSHISRDNLEEPTIVRIKSSWEVNPGAFIIDDTGGGSYTWEEAVTKSWCNGSGTWNDPYVIKDIKVKGWGGEYCVFINNSNAYFIIRNCTFYDTGGSLFYAGLKLNNVSNGQIIQSQMIDNGYSGIGGNCFNTTFSDNNITDNLDNGITITIMNSSIINNNISYNGDSGIRMSGDFNNISLNNITFNENIAAWSAGIFTTDAHNNTFMYNKLSNNNQRGIALYTSDDNYVYDNILYKNGGGVIVNDGRYNLISKNNITNGTHGILIYQNGYNNVVDNIIKDTLYYGVLLWQHTILNNITDNLIMNNGEDGIKLNYAEKNNISNNNIISNSHNGIYLLPLCDYNIFSENNIDSNERSGINLSNSCESNIFLKNNVSNHQKGIYFKGGCYGNNITGNRIYSNTVYGLEISNDLSNNRNHTIWDNKFESNNEHAIDNGMDNKWDDGTRGNFWDDYTGIDLDIDGIGDTEYYILGSAGSIDRYPVCYKSPPEIIINSPIENMVFSSLPPDFNIELISDYLSFSWYTINENPAKHFFFTNDTINSFEWNLLSDGNNTIIFHANSTWALYNNKSVIIVKDTEAPEINIQKPHLDDKVGREAPLFSLVINEISLNTTWYSLNGGTNQTFNGIAGTINQSFWQTLWDSLQNGGIITINFYVNDSFGRETIATIQVIKYIASNNDDTPNTSNEAVPGFDLVLIISIISVISCIFLYRNKLKLKG